LLFKKKLVFKFPLKKKYLFYDSNKRFDYLIKAEYEKIEIRNQINFFVLIYSFFFFFKRGFKLNISYLNAYISIVKPKIVFTFTDNDLSFYKLKIHNLNIKFISIQNGTRLISGDMFALKKIDKNLICDEIYVHNKFIGNEYKKMIKSNIILAGSLLNNFHENKKKKIKYDITFISQFSIKENFRLKNYLYKKILWEDFYNAERKVLKIIEKFTSNNNLLLNICARLDTNNDEKIFYKNILKNNFLYSVKNQNNNQYDICDQSNLVVFIDSTLGYENMSRGNKTVGFSIRKEIINDHSYKFGWPKYLPSSGPSWTSAYNEKLMYKLLQDNFYQKKKNWNILNKKYLKDLMIIKKNNFLNTELFK
jgi:surface carbohydrate biosynthesis protein